MYAADVLRETLGYLEETYGYLGREFLDRQTEQLDSEDDWSKTALHVVAEHANIEVIMALLLMGAGKDVSDSQGAKPIDYARTLLMEDIDVGSALEQQDMVGERELERRKQAYELLGGDPSALERQ